VAHAERARVEELLAELDARVARDGRRGQEEAPPGRDGIAERVARGAGAGDVDDAHAAPRGKERLRVAAPGRVLGAQARGAVEVERRGLPALDEAARLEEEAAVLAHPAAAVE